MPYCAVPRCVNGSGETTSGSKVKFFCFPKDEQRARLWWLKIKREGNLRDVKDPRVCSDHFENDDYQRDLQFELLNPGTPLPLPKLRLIDSAYPNRNIPATHARYETLS